MKNRTKIIITSVVAGVVLIGASVGSWYGSKAYYKTNKPNIVVKPNGPTTTTVINTPSTPDEWLKWKKAPIKITGKMKANDIFLVTSTDGYKMGTQEFKIKANCKEDGKNIIIFSYVGGIDYRATFKWQHGAAVSYYRMLIPMVGLGINVIATESNIFIAPGIIVKF